MNDLAQQDTPNLNPIPYLPQHTSQQIDLNLLTREAARIAELPLATAPAVVSLCRHIKHRLEQLKKSTALADISDYVAYEFRLAPDSLRSKSRKQRIVFARQVAMALCRRITQRSYPTIAEHFGRDHSTAIYAVEAIELRAKRDSAFARLLERMEREATGVNAAKAA